MRRANIMYIDAIFFRKLSKPPRLQQKLKGGEDCHEQQIRPSFLRRFKCPQPIEI